MKLPAAYIAMIAILFSSNSMANWIENIYEDVFTDQKIHMITKANFGDESEYSVSIGLECNSYYISDRQYSKLSLVITKSLASAFDRIHLADTPQNVTIRVDKGETIEATLPAIVGYQNFKGSEHNKYGFLQLSRTKPPSRFRSKSKDIKYKSKATKEFVNNLINGKYMHVKINDDIINVQTSISLDGLNISSKALMKQCGYE